jgi:hypothetical protein
MGCTHFIFGTVDLGCLKHLVLGRFVRARFLTKYRKNKGTLLAMSGRKYVLSGLRLVA